jgi:xanthine dehydrogenase molybdenum-binding subunit
MSDSTKVRTDGFRVIGTRPIRHDGVDKVTGRAKYGADYAFAGMLHGKVLRSPHAHARIKSINYEKALHYQVSSP